MTTHRHSLLAACLTLVFAHPVAAADPPLVAAIKQRDIAAVRALLNGNSDVNASQADGATALHWAAHRDSLEVVTALLQAGARASAANELGVNPLHLAAINGNPAIIEALLGASANPDAATAAGETALMMAARSGNPEAVEALLARGAQVNLRERAHGQTALMWAAAARHPSIVRLLISAGADVALRTTEVPRLVYTGFRYITSPPASFSNTVVEVKIGGFTALLFAAQQGDAETAAQLLNAGASVDDTDALGHSALSLAVHGNHVAMTELLLARGANPNRADVGHTPLHGAVLMGNAEIVERLLAHKADVNAQITRGEPVRKYGHEYALTANWRGATAFWLAARFAEPEILRLLAAAGADPGIRAEDSMPPLLAAILPARGGGDRRDRYSTEVERTVLPRENPEDTAFATAQAVIQSGSPLGVADVNGDTAVHLAAANRFSRVIQLLADSGADVSAKNGAGLTPLQALLKPPSGGRGGGVGAGAGGAAAPGGNGTRPELNAATRATVDLLRSLGGQ